MFSPCLFWGCVTRVMGLFYVYFNSQIFLRKWNITDWFMFLIRFDQFSFHYAKCNKFNEWIAMHTFGILNHFRWFDEWHRLMLRSHTKQRDSVWHSNGLCVVVSYYGISHICVQCAFIHWFSLHRNFVRCFRLPWISIQFKMNLPFGTNRWNIK